MTPSWIGCTISGVTCYGSVIYNCVAVKAGNHVVWKVLILRDGLVNMLAFQVSVESVGAALMCKAAAYMAAFLLSSSEGLSIIISLVESSSWHWFLWVHCSPVSCQPTRVVMVWVGACIMRADVIRGTARESRPEP